MQKEHATKNKDYIGGLVKLNRYLKCYLINADQYFYCHKLFWNLKMYM